mmetsp:Transcript_13722/g.28768  ORF Transcript_13722/g.28768 Transcript_13722/m.28768 type:complete len:218 (+) Transcript_13722:149-802(+)
MLLSTNTIFASIRHHARQRNIKAINYFMSTANKTCQRASSTSPSFHEVEKHRACNQQYNGVLNIRDSPASKGLGIFASKDFAAGDLIVSSKPLSTTKERCSHSVQIDWDQHVLMDLPAILINHSCNGNVGIRSNDNKVQDGDVADDEVVGAYDFWAIRPIKEGQELTWDYEATEWELCTPFDCNCGSPNCRGQVRGFKDSGDVIREQYGDYHAEYLK